MAKTKTRIALIREYFFAGEKLSEYKVELQALSDEEKLDLAREIAKHQGLTQEDVDFPLT